MMMQKSIGIFDSGVGGLTVVKELINKLPGENIVYFGDTAHVPYGSKSPDTVTRLSFQNTKFLLTQNIKILVVACNTASSFALSKLRKYFPQLPIIGVIEPGVKAATRSTKNRRIGVIGTRGTIRSRAYQRAIGEFDSAIQVFSKACPLFVPLVEENWIQKDVTYSIAREYLSPLCRKGIDTLILGCTHYPLLKEVLKEVAGTRVRLIDSAQSTAEEVERVLKSSRIKADTLRKGNYSFFVSDISTSFVKIGERFLDRKINNIKKIALE